MKIKERIRFLKRFISDKNVASVTPSSKFSVEKICSKIDFNRDLNIVEYGPGNGVFTKKILSEMTANSRLLVLETNIEFVDHLKQIGDSRLHVFHEKAENVKEVLRQCNLSKVDYVISGIPLSYLDKATRASLLENTYKILDDAGNFMTYQFLFTARKEIKEQFEQVNTDFEIRNIPPLFIFEAAR